MAREISGAQGAKAAESRDRQKRRISGFAAVETATGARGTMQQGTAGAVWQEANHPGEAREAVIPRRREFMAFAGTA